MFIGHFAVGLAAKRAAPAVSLGTLFFAAQFADLLWPNLVLLGIEHFSILPGITVVTPLNFEYYPYSHSLIALLIWAGVVALTYRAFRHSSRMSALVIFVLVISHWLLDVISHRADVPISLGSSTKVGMNLWASRPATIIVETVMFVAGILIYLRATKPRDRTGVLGLAGLVTFLLIINIGNMFGPPPPSVAAVAWSAQAIWLLVAWAYWVDRHRQVRTS